MSETLPASYTTAETVTRIIPADLALVFCGEVPTGEARPKRAFCVAGPALMLPFDSERDGFR
jgi:hypothetical protein